MSSPSKVRKMFDADASVTLRDIDDGAETSTATETGISLAELDTAYWHNGEIPAMNIVVGVHVSAIDNTTGDETYTLALLVDDVAAMSDTPKTVASIQVKSTGYYEMIVAAKDIPTIDTDTSGTDKFLAIKATLAGTTPSITYGAWVAKNLRA